MSATPHNGYQESFTALLELLDDQRFARTVMPDEKQLQRIMIRRLKSDLVDADNQPLFPVRKLECLEVDYSDEELEIHNLLQKFIRSRSQSVQGTRYAYATDFVHVLLKKRLFSSPMAFAVTLAKHRESFERNNKGSEARALKERILHRAIVQAEGEYENEDQAEDAQGQAIDIASELSIPLSQEQRIMLDKLSNWAERAKNRADSKANAILSWLSTYLKPNGQWNKKRVILFTEYRATHEWLRQILATHGFGGDRLMVLHGGTPLEEREKIKAAFQTHPDISPVRILLATDAASEGIDLQNHCNYMIHVEIPWNPNIMEQRNGRIDRHGQREKAVFIWHPVGKGFNTGGSPRNFGGLGDHEYLMRAALKVEQIREDLGTVGPVISQQILDAMLGKRKTLDISNAESKERHIRRLISVERRLHERITRLHEKLLEAKSNLHLDSEHIERTVRVALELAEKPPLKSISLPGVPNGKVFEVPTLPGSWGRATAGLEHPHTGFRRPITFDHDVAKGRDDVVLVHLNHKLVQMCLRLLREELWKLDDVKLLHRVTVRCVPDTELQELGVAVWSRLLITGGGHNRLHEEITLAGGEIKDSGFTRIPQIGRLESLLERSIPIEPSPVLFSILEERFKRDEESIWAAVEARSRDRLKYLGSTLSRRKLSEIDDVLTVLNELEQNLKNELEDDGPQQMELQLWPEEERNQLRRDMDALRARLERIPEEKKREIASVQSRYKNLVDRTFPVAVVFLVPQSQLEKGR